jgi:SsrA-binding protein
MNNTINIKNKKGSFNYIFLDKFTAGIMLVGTEIKSIRNGGANFVDSYCEFINGELWLKGLHIAEYKFGENHDTKRFRKLLLTKRELKKLSGKVIESGLTIVPVRLFINDKGLAKVEIALAKGKKLHDKRETIKKRDSEREISKF